MLSGDIGDEVNVNGNWGVIGQPGFGIPITVKLDGMYIVVASKLLVSSSDQKGLVRHNRYF